MSCIRYESKAKHDSFRRWQQILEKAAKSHTAQRPGHQVVVGCNFVECLTCGAHAHIELSATEPPVLVSHTSLGSDWRVIRPEDF